MAFRPELADFAAFYERTSAASYRTALGICGDPGLAADVTQDAYVAAFRERDRFRGDVPSGAWLHRIVVNAAISALRTRHPVRWIDPEDGLGEGDRAAPDADPADSITVRDAVALLEPRQRAAVVLRYYHDLDYAAIAQILGTSTGTVGSLLSRALDRLRRDLAPTDDESAVVAAGTHGKEARDGR